MQYDLKVTLSVHVPSHEYKGAALDYATAKLSSIISHNCSDVTIRAASIDSIHDPAKQEALNAQAQMEGLPRMQRIVSRLRATTTHLQHHLRQALAHKGKGPC